MRRLIGAERVDEPLRLRARVGVRVCRGDDRFEEFRHPVPDDAELQLLVVALREAKP